MFNIAATLAPNTAPAGIASMVTTNEDTPYVFKTSDFPFIDAENNSLKSIVIGSPLPQMGVLRLFNGVNFVDVMPNQRIDAYDLNLGRLRFDPLPVNSNSSFFASILFKIQDDGGNCNGASDTDAVFRQLTIRVPSVNDPPEGSNKSIFISNGQPYTLSLPDFPISDPNDSPFNHLAAVRIMSLPMGGTLTNARTAVAAGQFVTLDDIVLGNLIYTPPAAGQPAGILTFIVQDDGGTANGGVDRDPTPNSIYFLTTPNHPPEGTDRVITINEDNSAQLALADFPFTDPGEEFPNNLQSIKIVSLPTTGQLLHFGQVISVGQFIGAAELSPGSTALVYQPAANESGSPYANFSFQLQDDGGTAGGGVDLDPTPNTVVFNVTPVNDPPFGTDTTISAVDNSSLSIRSSYFGFDDQLDNPPNALRAVKFVTLPAFGNLELDGEPVNVGQFVAADDMDAGLLKFVVPRADESLVTEFRFILQDDGGTANGGSDLGWSPNSLRIQVHSYCNLGAPYFSRWTAVTAMEDQPYTFNSDELGVYDIYGYGLPSPQGVIIQALPQRGTLLNNGLPILAGQAIPLSDIELGRIQFVGSRDTNGAQSASFTLKVLDPVFPLCGDTGKGTVTVDVLPVNDAPSFAKGGDLQSHDLDGPRAILGWAKGITLGPADEVAQKVKFEAISDHSELFEQQPQFDLFGNLSFQPKAGASGRAVVSVVLIDDGGTANGGIDRSAPQSFTIDILYSHPLHNRVNATDVTGDGHTFAEDALEVINYINAHGSGPVNVNLPSSLQSLTVTGQSRPRYYDVTADDNIAPDDVMAIINYINARPAAEGEASSPHSQNSADSADESLFLLLAADAATQLNRRK